MGGEDGVGGLEVEERKRERGRVGLEVTESYLLPGERERERERERPKRKLILTETERERERQRKLPTHQHVTIVQYYYSMVQSTFDYMGTFDTTLPDRQRTLHKPPTELRPRSCFPGCLKAQPMTHSR